MKSKRTAIFVFAICVAAMTVGVPVSMARGWTRSLPIGEVAANERTAPDPFVLEVWSGDDDHDLYGLCTYNNLGSGPVRIDGIETEEGDFYPHVTFQVADQKDGSPWKTISEAIRRQGKPAIVTVEPRAASKTLKIDLDVFRPFVGKGKFARLLLKNGDAAIFQIDDLQPPGKMTESSADFVKETK